MYTYPCIHFRILSLFFKIFHGFHSFIFYQLACLLILLCPYFFIAVALVVLLITMTDIYFYMQRFQPPYHFIVLPRAFHSIFSHLIVFFMEKNVFTLVLKIAYSNARMQAHSQAVVLLVVVLKVRRILLSSNTSSKANYGLCAETGKTACSDDKL